MTATGTSEAVIIPKEGSTILPLVTSENPTDVS
jgi:hypothetical protein